MSKMVQSIKLKIISNFIIPVLYFKNVKEFGGFLPSNVIFFYSFENVRG